MARWMAYPFLAVVLSGCTSVFDVSEGVNGRLFTYVKKPYTRDLDNTPVPATNGMGKVILIREPFSGYGVSTEFDSNAIGDIAHARGMKEVYFADMEEISFLGVWKVRRLYVYGE